jgi:hypothetical protein
MPSHDQDIEDRWLTQREVSERERAPLSSVRYWRRMGTGPEGTLIGSRVLYKLSDVIAWEQSLIEADRARRAGAA